MQLTRILQTNSFQRIYLTYHNQIIAHYLLNKTNNKFYQSNTCKNIAIKFNFNKANKIQIIFSKNKMLFMIYCKMLLVTWKIVK